MKTRYWLSPLVAVSLFAAPLTFANTSQPSVTNPTLVERLQSQYPGIQVVNIEKRGGPGRRGMHGGHRGGGGGMHRGGSRGGHSMHRGGGRGGHSMHRGGGRGGHSMHRGGSRGGHSMHRGGGRGGHSMHRGGGGRHYKHGRYHRRSNYYFYGLPGLYYYNSYPYHYGYTVPIYIYGGAAGDGYYWRGAKNGHVPRYAMISHYRGNTPVFVCRANYRGKGYRGRLYPGRGCSIRYSGRTIVMSHYRVLMRR